MAHGVLSDVADNISSLHTTPPLSVDNRSYSQQHPPHEQTGHDPLFSLCDAVEKYTDSTNYGSSLHEYNDQYLGYSATLERFLPAACQGPTWGAGTHTDELEAISNDPSLSQQLAFEGQLLEQDYDRLQRDSVGVNRSPINQGLPVQSYHPYLQQNSFPGQAAHGTSFLPRNVQVVERYTDLSDDQYLDTPANPLSMAAMGNEGTNNSRIEFNVTSDDNAVSSLTKQLAFQHVQQLSEQKHGTQGASIAFFKTQSSYQQSSPRIIQKKISCTFPGCSKMMKKDGLTRHLREVHFRVVKGVCTRCRKTFQRQYLKKDHEVKCRG